MSDYSLVPVEHQPDFSDATLIPVEHDPYSADDAAQQAQAQPVQPQTRPVAGVARPDAGAGASSTPAPDAAESWSPDGAARDNAVPTPSTASTPNPGHVPFKPFGELKPATFTPTQRIGNAAADAGMALGMQPYTANDLATRIGNVLGVSPFGTVGSALDLIDAYHRGDLLDTAVAAAGMIPGVKRVARVAGQELHHAWPKYPGGAVKQELVPLEKELHKQFHSELDKTVPRRSSKAHYDNLDPTEKQKAFQKFVTHTKKFDAEHGTALYDAAVKNGFPAP
jgi:hypothetical protein